MADHFQTFKKRPAEITAVLVRQSNALDVGRMISAKSMTVNPSVFAKMVFAFVLPSGVVISVPDGDYIVRGETVGEYEVWPHNKVWELYEVSDD